MRISDEKRKICKAYHRRQIYIRKISGYEVLKVPMSGEVNTCGIPEDVLMKDADFASRVVKAVLPDTSIAIRFVNNAFKEGTHQARDFVLECV